MLSVILDCCAGLDVHKNVVWATLLKSTESGETKKVRDYKTFSRKLAALAAWLKKEGVQMVVMESTGVYWKSVYEALENADVPVMVVNALHVKKVPGRKTDISDSEWLAELARCGLLHGSFVPPKDLREVRLLTRYRMKLVRNLASEKNRLHKVLDDCGVRLGSVVSDIDGVSAREMIASLITGEKSPDEMARLGRGRLREKAEELRLAMDSAISDRHRYLLGRIESHIIWLKDDIAEIDGQIVAAMEPYQQEWQSLQTIPGLDEMSAAMLLAEIGSDMSSFPKKSHLSSWAGMCPGNNASAGKKKSGRTRKGNRYVKTILCEAAQSARRTQCQFKDVFQGLAGRRGYKRAIIAVGRKMLETAYIILKRNEPYRDPVVTYEELMVRRNAPRWLRALKKFGYLPDQTAAATIR